jgi:hypothetical protein
MYIYFEGFVRWVNEYNILQHELTTAMQYQFKSLRFEPLDYT